MESKCYNKFKYKIWKNEFGETHRENAPAVEFADGNKYWLQKGKLHRLDGPAIEHTNGHKSWWKYGRHYKSQELWFKSLSKKCRMEIIWRLNEF